MENIDDILVDYVKAYLELNRIISERAKGDWTKLDLLVANDESVRGVLKKMEDLENEFREITSLDKVFTHSDGFEKLFQIMNTMTSPSDPETSITYQLQCARDMIEGILTDGKQDDRVKALDAIFLLPNFSPDDWISRKYTMKGFYLPETAVKLPSYLIQSIEEACRSFIYGNFRASIALSRSVVEMALRARFNLPADSTLNDLVNRIWPKIKGLKERDDIRQKVDRIRRHANQILHHAEGNKIERICNELACKTVLANSKIVIEFLYSDRKF